MHGYCVNFEDPDARFAWDGERPEEDQDNVLLPVEPVVEQAEADGENCPF